MIQQIQTFGISMEDGTAGISSGHSQSFLSNGLGLIYLDD